MSLIRDAMTACTRLLRSDEPDGYGGQSLTWSEGEEFAAAFWRDYAAEKLAAMSAEPGPRFQVFTDKDTVLAWHDVFRREADGKIFRTVSNGGDLFTPDSSGLDLRQVTAEPYDPPDLDPDQEEVAAGD